MSVPFADAPMGLSNTMRDYQGRLDDIASKAKQKKEETSKTIEEGLGGLKVMLGGKGVSKAFIEDPLVQKYGAQLKKQAIEGVKKAGNKALDNIGERVDGLLSRGEALPNPAAVREASTDVFNNPLFSAGEAEVGTAASEAQLARTAEIARVAAGAGRARYLQQASTIMGQKAQEAAQMTQNFGREARFDSWDTPESSLPPAYSEANPLTSSATTPPNQAPTLDAEPRVNVPNAEAPPSGNAPTSNPGSSGNQVGRGGRSVEDSTLGDDAAVGAGEDAAVGAGEAVLAGLDAIPFLDLFTLAAGAGLAGAAAAKKRKPDAPAMQPPAASHVAFQAGYGSI